MEETTPQVFLIGIAEPDYSKLHCPQCGNTTDFIEFAMTDTKQRVRVKQFATLVSLHEVPWEFLDYSEKEIMDEDLVEEVICGKCSELVSLWKAPRTYLELKLPKYA
jgi:phage FluMu protein Com